MLAEGELRSNLDESDKVRDLQDRIADLKAEVCTKLIFFFICYLLLTNQVPLIQKQFCF